MGVSSPSYFINHIIKNKKNMKNLIIVPFDLNTARKIKSGEIEGSVLIDNIEIEFVYESKDRAGPYNLLFVRKACESVIRDHVLNELNIIVRSKSEKCTCENRVPSEEDKKESTDGLYIIYKDGHAEPFTGDNPKDCVRYIGLKHKDVSFAISLTEHDIIQLLDDDSREESGSGTYYERECDALFDIDGRGNTERLVTRNPKLRNLLEDGEYIPSLGQLNLMAHYMDELNKAFAYVSASPLSSTWYRSSTESSPSVAWYVDFSIGSAYYSDKYNSSRVRAVIDF